jgi:hypothetical protein
MSVIRVTRQRRILNDTDRKDVVLSVDSRELAMNWAEFRALAEAVREFDEKTKHGAGMNLQITKLSSR